MNSDEAKAAFYAGTPIQHNGIVYEKITAMIYRIRAGAVVLSVELTDKNSNSVTIADPARVETTTK